MIKIKDNKLLRWLLDLGIIDNKYNNKSIKSNYFSWYILCNKTNLNVYWVSFKKEGSICGDHAF